MKEKSNTKEKDDIVIEWKVPIEPFKLNLGCGSEIKPGYVNVDCELPDPSYASKITLSDILSLPQEWTDKADEILCEGSLEHLRGVDIPQALKEIHRVLKPGGKAVLVVPDLEYVCEIYASSRDDTFMKNWALYMLFGLQTRPGQFHRCGFSTKSFRDSLEAVGFKLNVYTHTWRYSQKVIVAECTK